MATLKYKYTSDNDVREVTALLNQLKQRIKDYSHVNHHIAEVSTAIDKAYGQATKELELREG